MTSNNLPAEAWHDPYQFEIRATDTDYHDRLHLFSLFSLMQEAAGRNARKMGLGNADLDVRDICWLLIRISVRLDHLPHWGETITIDTWDRGVQKLTFLRDFDFYGQDGRKFGYATSEWLIASKDAHRPLRPDAVLPAGYQPACSRAVFDSPVPRPLKLDEPAASQSILTKYADFSDIDRNHHVNNTRYIAWCVDAVQAAVRAAAAEAAGGAADPAPADGIQDIRIRGLDIHYISEVRLGSKIHCYCQADGDLAHREYRMEGRRTDDNAAVFRARVLI